MAPRTPPTKAPGKPLTAKQKAQAKKNMAYSRGKGGASGTAISAGSKKK